VDRQLKKVAKTDEFKEGFWHLIGFGSEHVADIKKYGAIALGALVLAGGIYFFVQHQADVREQALADAMKVDDATVANNPQPAAMHFDTEEQKQKHLPQIAAGELCFCIGLSEPNSGSDVFAASTRATKTDGGWLVNGRKIWTSGSKT